MRQLFQARRLCVKSIGKCSNIGTTSRDLHYQNSGPDYRSVRINPAARRGTALGVFPLDLVDSTDEEIERLVEVRDGSFTTEPSRAIIQQCPLRPDSDRSRHESELTRCAGSRRQ